MAKATGKAVSTVPEGIKIKAVPLHKEMKGDWTEAKKLAIEVEKAAKEIETTLDNLAKQSLSLHEILRKAYTAAPVTDSGFGFSPINPATINFALKRHLIKRGLRVDNTFIIEPEKALGFSDHVKDAMKWLLKFSFKGDE